VRGILLVSLILYVNDVFCCNALYDVYIEVIGTIDYFLFHDTHQLFASYIT
jgi:hypothetical protein